MGYKLENIDTSPLEMNHFYELFTPAYNLWEYYMGGDVAVQYERFMELIVASAVQIYTKTGYRDFILQEMATTLDSRFTEAEKIVLFEGDFE